MREIKFRAWDGEKMHYDTVPFAIRPDGIMCIGSKGYNETQFNVETNIDCIAKAVMQYTGLRDKNGKEIWEGDIVRKVIWGYKAKREIEDFDEWLQIERVITYEIDGEYISYYYDDGRDVVTMERFPTYWLKNESFGWEGEDLWDPEYCEVIGSVHEHPHLLEGETE